MAGKGATERGGAAAAVGLLALTMALWGGAFRATAVGSEHAPSLMFSALRTGPAAALLLLAVLVARARLPSRRQWVWAGASGLLMVTFTTQAMVMGTTRAGAGTAAVLINTSPLFVALAGGSLLGERVSWLAGAGLAIGFAGVVTMAAPQLGGGSDSGELALGMGLCVAVSAAWAAGILIIKRVAQRDPGLDMLGFTAAQYAIGAPILVVVALGVQGTGGTQWSSGDLWAALAWLVLGVSALASVMFFTALKRLSANRVSAWQFVAPVIAVLVEIVRGASPGALELGGMALTIAGVAVVTCAPQAAERPLGVEPAQAPPVR